MRAGSVTIRSSRSVPRAGAVVVVLLAALLHLLGCCHGPATAETLRTDALTQVPPGGCGQQPTDGHRETASGQGTYGPDAYGQSAAGQGTPAPDEDAHCCAADEPTVQPSRHPRPSGPPLPAVLLSDPPGPAPAVPPPVRQHSPAVPAVSSAGDARALLGVWRT
ncbi:hypothetical protein ACFV2N_05645 [Streptomyces sp. NPDC059680]|uniref:hypothetical protein n=1 Tax=Streptomyces sp. NPDC059680 TaxID=3346904 RepID=UPI0036BC61F9